jgi:hypothetical protein
MKPLAEGFWTALTLLCSGLIGLISFVYSFIESVLASKFTGTSLIAELHAYRLRSRAALVVSLVSLLVFLLVFGVAAVRRRRSHW